MFKVVLVDDEPMAMEALRLAADWEKSGFYICGECSNGEEALRVVEELHPDLVVTDVKMPVMDGLELVSRVVENMGPGIRFMMVSGYDEFDYAKRAMKFGIEHFVLKPVFEEEFSNLLAQIYAQLDRQEKMKKLHAESEEADIEIFFEGLLTGKFTEEMLEGEPLAARLPANAVWVYAVLDIPFPRWVEHSEEETGPGMSMDDLKKELSGAAFPHGKVFVVSYTPGVYGVVLCSDSENALDGMITDIAFRLVQFYADGFYLSVGNPVKTLTLLSNSMEEAEAALDYRFFDPARRVLYYRDFTACSFSYSLHNLHQVEDVLDALEHIDSERLAGMLESVFASFRSAFVAPEVVKMYVIHIISTSHAIIGTMGGKAGELPVEKEISRLHGSRLSLNELERILREYCMNFCKYVQNFRDQASQTDRVKVEEYIRQNYKRSLTIREISRKLYIHPNYLGHQIHKWFGCSFNEYLHRLRIEEAKRLLTGTGLKAHEIALQVGYSIYSSFLQQFEKYTSMKPCDYRKFHKN